MKSSMISEDDRYVRFQPSIYLYIRRGDKMIELEYPNEVLPEELTDKVYKCEIHCYEDVIREKILFNACDLDAIQVKAFKLNASTGELFPAQQTFVASSNPDLMKILNKVISDNKIPSCWTDMQEEFKWSSYYNISISGVCSSWEPLRYHRVRDNEEETR